jgi:Tol biopolymer transport system component
VAGKGSCWPSEYQRLSDDKSGAIVHQLTQHPSINHNLYFLNRSFTPDEQTVVFTSYRHGDPNLFELAFPDGQIRQLTEGPQIHPFSACLSRSGEAIYFTRAGSVWKLIRTSLQETCLATFEDNKVPLPELPWQKPTAVIKRLFCDGPAPSFTRSFTHLTTNSSNSPAIPLRECTCWTCRQAGQNVSINTTMMSL